MLIKILKILLFVLWSAFLLWVPYLKNMRVFGADFFAAPSVTTKNSVSVSIGTGVRTTSLYNGDGSGRIIDNITFFADASPAGNTSTNQVFFATSSDGVTPSGILSSASFLPSTSTYSRTSTFGVPSTRWWAPGTYILCYSLASMTTTNSSCTVDYNKP